MSLNLKSHHRKINMGEIPWWFSGWESLLSLLRSQVQSVVGELRSCKLHSTAKKNGRLKPNHNKNYIKYKCFKYANKATRDL